METIEIIAELRKQGLSEAADRMESLDKRWKRTRAERDGERRMRERAERLLAEELSRKPTGDLISRSAVLTALSSRLSIVDMVGVAEIVESVPAVCEDVYPDWYRRLSDLDYDYHPEPNGEPWYQAKDVWACIEEVAE